jgi:hypothetical protein
MTNVSAQWLKTSEPSGLSVMNVDCSVNNKNGDGKPVTATISASRTNDSVATSTSTITSALHQIIASYLLCCLYCLSDNDNFALI